LVRCVNNNAAVEQTIHKGWFSERACTPVNQWWGAHKIQRDLMNMTEPNRLVLEHVGRFWATQWYTALINSGILPEFCFVKMSTRVELCMYIRANSPKPISPTTVNSLKAKFDSANVKVFYGNQWWGAHKIQRDLSWTVHVHAR
jgi:hypothetical protein